MPIYEYECRSCKKNFERFHKIARVPKRERCDCGMMARLIISSHGAVITDGDVRWLDSAKANLPSDAKNITTRGEYKRYLKDHALACVG
jgi:putative FmdB family regulatory protein